MDQDDPEKRVANLEQQLEPPQPNAAFGTGSGRRFVARGIPKARQNFFTLGLLSMGGVVWLGAGAALAMAAPTNPAVIPLVMLVGLVVLVVLALFRLYPRKVVICVTAGGLTTEQRPDEVFSFRDAQLGQWRGRLQRFGPESAGRALYLTAGPHRFVLGAADRRVASQLPVEGPQIRHAHLDAWTSPQVFDELLAIVGPHRQTTRESDLPATQPRRPQPSAAPETGSGGRKPGRIRAQIVSVFAIFCILGGLGFAFSQGVGDAISYRDGTPTTATIDHCDSTWSLRGDYETCYARWSVGGVSRTGPISGDYDRHGGVGSQVAVHVDRSSDRNGVYHAYTASEASPKYVMVSGGLFAFATGVVLWWSARRKVKTGSWPWSGRRTQPI